MDIALIIIGIAAGALIGWFLAKSGFAKEKAALIEKYSGTEIENSVLKDRNQTMSSEMNNLTLNLSSETEKNLALSTRIAKAEVEYRNLQEKLETQKADFEKLQQKFQTEFENIATRILKQNSQEFTTSNQKNISDILTPLKEKIEKFEKKVEDTYKETLKDQTDLKAELKKMYDLSTKLSEGTNNLTNALKSDNKKQGNWGELVLERILERSGLVKGQEYDTQKSTRTDDGDLIKPDVVIYLPENKHIIIDSKVSLVAYDNWVNSDNSDEKDRYLKLHIESMRNHIKMLGDKNYHNAGLFDTPDFVLLFVPIESSFSVAVQADLDLFNFAWDRKIVIVSPSTLLATLKTVESIWKQEKQNRNALEIARQGGSLYDKFISLISDFEKLGNQINTVQNTFEDTQKKLSSGRGNLISQVEKLKSLGSKTTRDLPEKYIDSIEN